MGRPAALGKVVVDGSGLDVLVEPDPWLTRGDRAAEPWRTAAGALWGKMKMANTTTAADMASAKTPNDCPRARPKGPMALARVLRSFCGASSLPRL
jgi:hypothetical protein